jgi:hypothetical protein
LNRPTAVRLRGIHSGLVGSISTTQPNRDGAVGVWRGRTARGGLAKVDAVVQGERGDR